MITINGIWIKVIVTLSIISYSPGSYSQGAWNLKYTPIDQLGKELVGSEVRIDFKSSINDTLSGVVSPISIRKLLSNNDTVHLTFDHGREIFIENWKLYPDHGVLNEQELVNLNGSVIREQILESISKNVLTIRVKIFRKNRNEYEFDSEEEINIERNIVKGIIYK